MENTGFTPLCVQCRMLNEVTCAEFLQLTLLPIMIQSMQCVEADINPTKDKIINIKVMVILKRGFIKADNVIWLLHNFKAQFLSEESMSCD